MKAEEIVGPIPDSAVWGTKNEQRNQDAGNPTCAYKHSRNKEKSGMWLDTTGEKGIKMYQRKYEKARGEWCVGAGDDETGIETYQALLRRQSVFDCVM